MNAQGMNANDAPPASFDLGKAARRLIAGRLAEQDTATGTSSDNKPQVGIEAKDARAPQSILAICHPAWLALAIMLAQVTLTLFLAGTPNLKFAYHQFLQWDSAWYRHIASNGYHATLPPIPKPTPDQSNVAFLPGYPLLGYIIFKAFHANIDKAMLIAAELACWGFWTYFLLILRAWRVGNELIILGVLALLVHPAAFFLVVGYSESLFLMMLLGMIFWAHASPQLGSGVLSGLHGFVMTATRIVGVPCAAYALLAFVGAAPGRLNTRPFWKGCCRAGLAGLLTILGILSFFLYCQLRWGQWNIYAQTQLIGWGGTVDIWALFRKKTYAAAYLADWQGTINPNHLSRLFLPITLACFAILFTLEAIAARCGSSGFRGRLGLHFSAIVLFVVPAIRPVGQAAYPGMIRYAFCCNVVMVLIVVHLLVTAPAFVQRMRKWAPAAALVGLPCCALCLSVQTMLIYEYLRGRWVA